MINLIASHANLVWLDSINEAPFFDVATYVKQHIITELPV
jgi:hypothetical protein